MRFRSSVVASAGAALLFGWLLATPAVADCSPDNAVFEDEFDFLDGSWGDATDDFYVEDGALIMKPGSWHVNFSSKNDGATDYCVDLTIADAPEPDSDPIGLIFWWQDWDNYYYLLQWAQGSVAVRRVIKGKSTDLFGADSLAIKKGVGQTNHYELKLRPKDATLLINGTEIKRFKGVQPAGGGVVGLVGLSSDEKPATFKFDNFVVSPLTE
jgi:hypothetical protein